MLVIGPWGRLLHVGRTEMLLALITTVMLSSITTLCDILGAYGVINSRIP